MILLHKECLFNGDVLQRDTLTNFLFEHSTIFIRLYFMEVKIPRKPRTLTDEGYYHIISRGINKKKIFHRKTDYEKFLTTIQKYKKIFQISILHYCLMPNHIHLLVQTQKAEDLPKFMQVILQVYAHYFRKQYLYVGHLFQNRYLSKSIEKETYLLECARYIERNPLRANLCQCIEKYPWSSYSHYAKAVQDDIIERQNPCYLALSKCDATRQHYYREYVNQDRPYQKIVDDYFRIS